MPYYDKETVRAVGEIDLISYLERTEPDELVRQGAGRYITKSHDSLTISNGKWCWYSRSIGGRNALTYLIKAKGLSFQDAVAELLRLDFYISAPSPTVGNQERKEFCLPPKAEGNGNARTYLLKRGIHPDVIDEQFESGTVYESLYTFGDSGKTQAQIVFLGFDEVGKARYAHIRGIDGGFKGDAVGSDKRFPFAVLPEFPASTLRVFEGAIDLLSYASILRYELSGYSTMHMVSLGGVCLPGKESHLPPALERTLETHPGITRVALHFDNDYVGREAAQAIQAALEKNFVVIDAPPPKCKDYNDYLRISHDGQMKPPIIHER